MRVFAERQEEVVYYDTYESPDAMKATDDPSTPLTPPRDDVAKLQQRTRQLEARRGRITAKKAYLKHKKVPEPETIRSEYKHQCHLVVDRYIARTNIFADI